MSRYYQGTGAVRCKTGNSATYLTRMSTWSIRACNILIYTYLNETGVVRLSEGHARLTKVLLKA